MEVEMRKERFGVFYNNDVSICMNDEGKRQRLIKLTNKTHKFFAKVFRMKEEIEEETRERFGIYYSKDLMATLNAGSKGIRS